MLPDKQVKREFKKEASKNPDKYYATEVLREEGFVRKQCRNCGTFFWTTTDRDVCGDPSCAGGFKFFDNPPAKQKLDYIGVWKRFSEIFKKRGYTPIERYPVTARWRSDTDFVQASIYDFQPYVVSGEVKPPANPLVVPQFCLRFNDIDNVGITGAHYTGFVMIGQHAFMPPEKFDQAKYFRDIHNWLKEGLGLPNDEITFHEDAWAGGGNFGPCMEFFSRGLELGNQVYMLYEQTPSGPRQLDLKALDMGMGHERNAWFTQGTSTSYETTFPTVVKMLLKKTGLKIDKDLLSRFLPYSSYLNVDETENIDKEWNRVANAVGTDVKELKDFVLPLSGLFSVGEHSRSLLVALSDGALPSNVGGGYNLRVILRRALTFLEKYGWDVSLPDVAEEHARYLKPLFPELTESITEVTEILEVERRKFEATKKKINRVVEQIIKKPITEEKLVELYDSQGISPELVAQEAGKHGIEIKIDESFYKKVAERHEKKEQQTQTKKESRVRITGVPETKALYYDDYKLTEFEGKVLKIIDRYVVLDRTAFYPTSGGQIADRGTLNGQEVVDVFKEGGYIVHELKEKPSFGEGETVKGLIDWHRRKQLAQHHTATHIINGAARRILGNHIYQAGAAKTLTYSRLDITHYEQLTKEQIKEIEELANEIIRKDLPVHKYFMPREEAEKTFGMRIYQGGAVPGKEIRIVEIPDFDIEACGGTHLDKTSEAEQIIILKTSKIQDGIVRIEFVAGNAAVEAMEQEKKILDECADLLKVPVEMLPGRVEELFEKWKTVRKKRKKKQPLEESDFELSRSEEYSGDLLERLSQILATQPEHVPKTIKRFLSDLDEARRSL
ncbi:alanine--tRNA ligase [Candidatus Woesearchaeota archaeon]|nr:MAG: alanine--tRNA ligase [Candidatus Woesearchaeota archaeon]